MLNILLVRIIWLWELTFMWMNLDSDHPPKSCCRTNTVSSTQQLLLQETLKKRASSVDSPDLKVLEHPWIYAQTSPFSRGPTLPPKEPKGHLNSMSELFLQHKDDLYSIRKVF